MLYPISTGKSIADRSSIPIPPYLLSVLPLRIIGSPNPISTPICSLYLLTSCASVPTPWANKVLLVVSLTFPVAFRREQKSG